MKTVQFKDESMYLDVKGIGRVDRHNITPELYDRLMSKTPNFGKYFNVKEVKEFVKESKPKKHETNTEEK